MAEKRDRPTARELEKEGAAKLAVRYKVTVEQIQTWKREARGRSGVAPALRRLDRVEQTTEILKNMKRRGLTIDDLAPDFADRELLEKLLNEDPGTTRDQRDRAAGYTKFEPKPPQFREERPVLRPIPGPKLDPNIDPGPGYFNARLGGRASRTATPPYRPDPPKPVIMREPAPDSSIWIFYAALIAMVLISLIILGVWK